MLNSLMMFLLLWVCYTDIRFRIIRNKTVLFIAITSIVIVLKQGELPYVLSSLSIFVVGTLLVCLNFIGAGDIKLMSALALIFPFGVIPEFIFYIALAGLPLSVIIYLLSFTRKGRFSRSVPYGVAIVSGYLLTLLV